MSRPAPAPAPRQASTTSTPPAPVHTSTPAPMQQQSSGGGMLSGIGSTIVQGMAFGTGSAIAHRAVGAAAEALTGGGSSNEAPKAVEQQQQPMMQQQQMQGVCANDKQMFFECLQINRGDQQACQFLYDQLQSCQQNQIRYA